MQRLLRVIAFGLLFLLVISATAQQVTAACPIVVAGGDVNGLITAVSDIKFGSSCHEIYLDVQPGNSIYHFTDMVGTYTALPDAEGDITIYGNGATFSLAAASDWMRLINVKALISLRLMNLTVIGGSIHNRGTLLLENTTFAFGFAIFNYGDLVVHDSLFTDNSNHLNGGAIHGGRDSSIQIYDSEFTYNRAERGGAIYTEYGTNLEIYNSQFYYNDALIDGGGLYLGSATVTLENVYVADNTAGYSGGGIYLSDVTPTLRRSTIVRNHAGKAGGGIFSQNQLIIENSTISYNSAQSGGGVSAYLMYADQAVFRGNTAQHEGDLGGIGGAIASSLVSIQRSEFSYNSATKYGGAIWLYDSYDHDGYIDNSTFAYNTAALTAPVIYNDNSTPIALHFNTFVGNSYAPNPVTNNPQLAQFTGQFTAFGNIFGHYCASSMQSFGYNIDFTGTCLTSPQATDQVGIAPQLEPLADNGGGMLTFALRDDSPALNAIPYGDCNYATDQRGMVRYHYGGCDIGAYESDHTNADVNRDRLITASDGIAIINRFGTVGYNFFDLNYDGDIDGDDVGVVYSSLSPTSITHLSCPSLTYTCSQISTCAEAWACFGQGNPNLDSDGDGIPCNESSASYLCIGG